MYHQCVRVSDAVYERLRSEIIEWELQPGVSLGEIETSERVGVSRTPVREALARLAAEGLVVAGGAHLPGLPALTPARHRVLRAA